MFLDLIFACIVVYGSMKTVEKLEELPDQFRAMKKNKLIACDILLVVLFIVGFALWIAIVMNGDFV